MAFGPPYICEVGSVFALVVCIIVKLSEAHQFQVSQQLVGLHVVSMRLLAPDFGMKLKD